MGRSLNFLSARVVHTVRLMQKKSAFTMPTIRWTIVPWASMPSPWKWTLRKHLRNSEAAMLAGMHPPLEEFVIALEKEIEAARRNNAASATLLSDGRLIAPVGSVFHYRFDTQTSVRVPPDTDGDLIFPDRPDQSILVTIIDTEELA